jgi:uncharacterized protein YecT (DUF1311 family)
MRAFCLSLVVSTAAASAFSAEAVAEPKVALPGSLVRDFSFEDSGCGGEGTLADVQCLGRYLQGLERKLNEAYAKALLKMPVSDPYDVRKNREQLRKSQRAWLKYRLENCALQGALEGGSNLWVTNFAAMCEERETKERILFLRSMEE